MKPLRTLFSITELWIHMTHDNVDEGNILSKRNHIKKSIYYMILFIMCIKIGRTNVW